MMFGSVAKPTVEPMVALDPVLETLCGSVKELSKYPVLEPMIVPVAELTLGPTAEL